MARTLCLPRGVTPKAYIEARRSNFGRDSWIVDGQATQPPATDPPAPDACLAGEERAELEHDFLDNAKSFSWGAVESMLRETPDLINVQPCGRWTALHQAAVEGNGDMCKKLLGMGADPAALTRSHQRPADVAKGTAKEVLTSASAPEARPDEPAEPPAKKAKKALVYTTSISAAVDKEYEQCSFGEIASAPTSALQGVAARGRDILKKFGVKTVRGLGRWKIYRMAKAIVGLSALEAKGHEGKELCALAKLPPSALQGLAGWADEELGKLHVKTIADLGNWKLAQWAEWIADVAEFEGPSD